MSKERIPIGEAIDELQKNMGKVARIYEWAELMGYKSCRLFSRHVIRHYKRRPSDIMKEVRLASIVENLHRNDRSCREVAWQHCLPDEKALNNYLNRHLNVSPTVIKESSYKKIEKLLENAGSKNGE